MKHEINSRNWHMDLVDKIEMASSADTIVCHTDAMIELGRNAQSRLCPEKTLIFIIENKMKGKDNGTQKKTNNTSL